LTVEGTSCRNSFTSDTPCAGCGVQSPEVWLLASNNLCLTCRNQGNMTTKAIVVHEAQEIETKQSVDLHKASFEELKTGASMFVLATQEDLETASEVVNEIASRLKTIDAEEKAATAPILAGIAKIRSWFAPARKAGDEALALWKAMILKSNEERRKTAAAATVKVQLAIAAGDSRTAALAHREVNPPEPVKGLQTRKVWQFTVINKGMLPAEYLVPNETAIRAEMRAQIAKGGEPVIPGVKFEQVESLAATGT
jgi:hypothetical protein